SEENGRIPRGRGRSAPRERRGAGGVGELAAGACVFGRQARRADAHLASAWAQQARGRLETGRLAGAVRPQQRQGLAVLDFERQRVDGAMPAVLLRERAIRDPRTFLPTAAARAPSPSTTIDSSSPKALARRGPREAAGTAGSAGGRASGARSSARMGSSTGKARSAAPSAAAARPCARRSAAVKLPRKWSKTLVSR